MTWHAQGRKLCLSILGLLVYCLLLSPHCLEAAANPIDLLTQGQHAFQQGAFEEAIFVWLAAAQHYEGTADRTALRETLRSLAQAYAALGHYRQAQRHLTRALSLAQQMPQHEAIILGNLGDLFLATGPLEDAERYLRDGLQRARMTRQPGLIATILNNLGNLLIAQEAYDQALEAYLESQHLAQQAGATSLVVRASINAATAARQQGELVQAQAYLDQALSALQQLPPSHEKAYDFITLGLAYEDLRVAMPQTFSTLQAATVLHEALTIAQTLNDKRVLSYAAGYLGSLYEAEQRYEEALRLTSQALFAAQQVQAPESLYRWQWQHGRLLQAQGQADAALVAYRQAVQTLQSFRQEMAWGYGHGRRSFRTTEEPVYLGLVDLLLQRAATFAEPRQAEPYLREAQETVERLKTVELQDYFQDDCVNAAQASMASLEMVSHTAVIIYPIILPDRLELLLGLPGGLRRVTVPVDAQTLRREAGTFRHFLEKRTTREYLPYAEKFYHWLIRPVEAELAAAHIDTLVFVPDGPLRNLPMAALYDGKQFLIHKYALAITPGLTLTNPQPLKRDHVKILAVGLSEAVQGFEALPFVPRELEHIGQLYEGTTLLDKTFLRDAVAHALQDHPFQIMHIASHGQFRSNLAETFLLTFDGRLTLDRLDTIIRPLRSRNAPLGLLTLSACQTATGDDRAALGLAGVAIKAGAQSALATLWYISDQASSDLITEFYRQLRNPALSRATALQRAQVAILQQERYAHPGYWAPFLLINNWL